MYHEEIDRVAESESASSLDELVEIRWHGRGGQGVVTAGKLLAEMALTKDWYFQTFPDYGPERMGAPIRAFTRLSSQPIHIHSQIEKPDVVVVLDPTLLGVVQVSDGLDGGGTLIVNTPMDPKKTREATGYAGGAVFTVDASHIAIEEMGRDMTNTPMLGAFARATGLFDTQEVAGQLRAWFGKKLPAKALEANIRAMERAADGVREG
jgi:pyruvate ferredoxin oxidoreductase gamma subunit